MKKIFTVGLLLAAHFSFAQLDSLLLANWSLDSDAKDKTPNAYHGSFVGKVTTTADRFGNNGCATYLPKGTFFQFHNGATDPFQLSRRNATISFWVRLSDIVRSDSAFLVRDNYEYPIERMSNYTLVLKPGNHLCLGVHFSYEHFELECSSVLNTPLPPLQWHHLVLVNDKNNNTAFYLNGTKISETQHHYGGESFNSILKFGELSDASFDDIRYYSRSLTALEVSQLTALPSSCGTLTGIVTNQEVDSDKLLIRALNFIGQEINIETYSGAAILIYSDGSREKVIK